MKKLLFVLATIGGVAYGKEIITTPEVLVESKIFEETTAPVVTETVTLNETLSVNNLYFRAGISPLAGYKDYSAKIEKENKKITDGKPDSLGYELGVEYTRNLNKNLELGLGAMYQSNSKLKSYS